MNYLAYFLFFVIGPLSTLAFVFEDCGSVQGKFTDVKISDCDPTTMTYCPLKKSTNVSIDLNFMPKEELSKINVVIHGYIAGVAFPFNLPNPDGCKDSGLTCPIASNTENTYKLNLPILKMYPKLKVTIKLELLDENDADVVCLWIPAKIV